MDGKLLSLLAKQLNKIMGGDEAYAYLHVSSIINIAPTNLVTSLCEK